MSTVTTISQCMTPSPHTIGEDIALSKAVQFMGEFKIRHLPVLKGGKLVGILTDRDVSLALSLHPQATDLKVGDIMTEDAYAVTPQTPLHEATDAMFRNKYGCTVVQDGHGKTVGIFTAVDALKIVTDVLRQNTKGTPLDRGLAL